MIMKVLALLAVLAVIYLIFFKTSRKDAVQENKQKREKPKRKSLDEDTMIECAKCSTFISTKEAIIKSGKFYCSRECAEL